MRNLIFFLPLLFTACNTGEKSPQNNDDTEQLTKLHENYKNFWLQNDSTKVVNLFSEDGIIIPPNNKGGFVKGKKAIGAWWFTATGDTTYPITSFVYKNDSLTLSGELATWEGLSEVGWNTVAGDSVLSSHSSASNFITVCKKENGEWKIYRQIWNVRPKK
jgi:ketosteroid isomerase-like protein